MGCWFTGPGLGACIFTKYIRRVWLRGSGTSSCAFTPLVLGRKMKSGGVLKTSQVFILFFFLEDEEFLFRFSATLCEIR